MATLEELHSRIDSAIAALDGGEYAAAITHCDAALLMLAVIPDTQFDQTDQIRFDRQGANEAIKTVKRTANARRSSSMAITQKIRYRRG